MADYSHNAELIWCNADNDKDNIVNPGTAVSILKKLSKLATPDVDVVPLRPQGPTTQTKAIKLSGLAGRIADIMRLAGDRELIVFPYAAALTAMSALAAPSYVMQGPQGKVCLNLFAMLLGGTGSGKEACRGATDMVLKSAGRSDERLDGIASDRALHRALADAGSTGSQSSRATLTIAIDESGLQLAAIRSGNNGHQQQLLAMLMGLFGQGLKRLPPHKYADSRNEIPAVPNPRVTLIWTSTPKALEGATSQEDSESGQLNRFLVFREEGLPPLRAGKVDRDVLHNPPDDIVQACRRFGVRTREHAVGQRLRGEDEDFIVTMSAEAVETIEDFRTGEVENQRRQQGLRGETWARANEYALRIAGLLALSDAAMMPEEEFLKGVFCEIGHIETAKAIVRRALTNVQKLAENAGRTKIETLKDKFKEAIERLSDKEGYAPAHAVHKAVLRGEYRSMKNDLIEGMIEDGEIIREERKTKGRSGSYYAIAKMRDEIDNVEASTTGERGRRPA